MATILQLKVAKRRLFENVTLERCIQIEKVSRFSQTLSGRRFLLTYFETVTLRLFGFLFSCQVWPYVFCPEKGKTHPKIT